MFNEGSGNALWTGSLEEASPRTCIMRIAHAGQNLGEMNAALSSALRTPRGSTSQSGERPRGPAAVLTMPQTPTSTTSSEGGFWRSSSWDDSAEVAEMVESSEALCAELEENCLEQLQTRDALKLVAFTRALAGRLKAQQSRRQSHGPESDKYNRMKAEMLESSLKIIHEVQESHKEAQSVLLQRIASLESSLAIAQNSYGEIAKMRTRLLEKEAECADLQAAMVELEEEERCQVQTEGENIRRSLNRSHQIEVSELKQKISQLSAERDVLASKSEAQEAVAVCAKCGGDVEAVEEDEATKIFVEFSDAISANLKRVSAHRVKSIEELVRGGTTMYTSSFAWGLKKLGLA